MKIRLWRKLRLANQGRFLLLLCLGLVVSSSYFPMELSATGNRVTVVKSVSQDTLPVLEMKSVPSPSTVQDFAKLTINKLSAEAPFKDWKDAKTEYYPLGPGTHSWLVNVMNGEQRIGYMIISATDKGGYMLSEYGAGTYGLPYSLIDLRQLLVQKGLISSSSSGTIKLTALYAPLLPVWKISINNKTLYINASVPEVLPWTLSEAETVLKGRITDTNLVTSLNSDFSPLSAYNSGGTDDPYEDIMWLTSPDLTALSGDNITALIQSKGSIAYQASGRNDSLGAPFMVTGYQSWLPDSGNNNSKNSTTTVYAASGAEGKRYLPLSVLQQFGTLHKLPENNTKALGFLH